MPTASQETLDQLWQLALAYLQTQQVNGNITEFAQVNLDDMFRILERASQHIERTELRRLWDLLIEFAVVRENTLLPQKESHEARLIKAIQHTGRLGKFLSLVLVEATSQV